MGIFVFSVMITILFNMVFIMIIPFVIKGVDIPPFAGSVILYSYVIASCIFTVKILGIK